MQVKTLILSVTIITLLFTGCRRQKMPEGLPGLVPCSVSITQNGTALEGAYVTLVNSEGGSEGTSDWLVQGRTNSSGKAVMYTLGKYKGAPKAKYKVLIEKTELDEADEAKYQELRIAVQKGERIGKIAFPVYTLVEEKYNSKDTSPLELQVEKKTSESFDIGEPVRIKIDTLTKDDV